MTRFTLLKANKLNLILDTTLRLSSAMISAIGFGAVTTSLVPDGNMTTAVTVAGFAISSILNFMVIPNGYLNGNNKLAVMSAKAFILGGWFITGFGIVDYVIKANDTEYKNAVSSTYNYDDSEHEKAVYRLESRVQEINKINNERLASIKTEDETLNEIVNLRKLNRSAYYSSIIYPLENIIKVPSIKRDANETIIRASLTQIARYIHERDVAKLEINVIPETELKLLKDKINVTSEEYINSLNKVRENTIRDIRLNNINEYVGFSILVLIFAYLFEFHIFNFILSSTFSNFKRDQQDEIEKQMLQDANVAMSKLKLDEIKLETERSEKDRVAKLQLEKVRDENLRIENDRIEKVRDKNEKLENDRIEKVRDENLRIENDRIEKVRAINEKIENDRIENDRIENDRIENDRIETLRIENEKLENDRIENDRIENLRIENDRIENLRIENDRLETDRIENDRIENLRIENDRIENLRIENDRIENDRIENLRIENDRIENDRLENLRIENDKIVTKALEAKEKLLLVQTRLNHELLNTSRLKNVELSVQDKKRYMKLSLFTAQSPIDIMTLLFKYDAFVEYCEANDVRLTNNVITTYLVMRAIVNGIKVQDVTVQDLDSSIPVRKYIVKARFKLSSFKHVSMFNLTAYEFNELLKG